MCPRGLDNFFVREVPQEFYEMTEEEQRNHSDLVGREHRTILISFVTPNPTYAD